MVKISYKPPRKTVSGLVLVMLLAKDDKWTAEEDAKLKGPLEKSA